METKKKIGFFKSMLSDDSGVSVSSKRVIGFIGFLILSITLFINSFTGKEVGPSVELVTAVQYIVMGALFGTSLDKIMNKKTENNESE